MKMLPRALTRAFHHSPLLHSAQRTTARRTLNDILDLYHKKNKIAVITAHDYISGKLADDAEADIVLVGDSLAMVALGYEDTNELPFDEFLYHCRAVSRGVGTSFLVADLPFGSYESSISKAIESSIQLVSKGRVNAIKLEGGVEITPTIERLTQLGIPVMGHVGLTPQRSNALSGFKVQGKSVESAERIIEDALRVQDAGAFSIVLEAIPHELGALITDRLSIPTIGIGAGPETSGQVLVQADLLGFYPGHTPKFVKKYIEGHGLCVSAMMKYVEEVKDGIFPEVGKHTYRLKEGIMEELRKKAVKKSAN